MSGQSPSKAEELFYRLKKLADTRGVVDMDLVRQGFRLPPYASIKKLEECGAVHVTMDATGSRKKIFELELLKDEVSIPRSKRGPKPKDPSSIKTGQKSKKVKKPNPISDLQDGKPVVTRKPSTSLPLLPAVKEKSSKPSASPASKRVMVFIDENQLIMPLKEGRGLDFQVILQSIKDAGLQEVVRVFIYCSEITEEKNLSMARNFFRLDDPLVRFIKTGNSPDEVDRRMKEDIILWSQIDFADTIVLGTSDGGPDFHAAIDEVKKAGKRLVLLKTGGSFNMTLCARADAYIDASIPNPYRRAFDEIILAASHGNFNSSDTLSRFVVGVAKAIIKFFKINREARFMGIVKWVNNSMINRFDGYTESDIKEAIRALDSMKRIFRWRKEDGRKVYRLSYNGRRFLGNFRKFA